MRKKAIVTGASRGIGRGIIRELAAAGYDIAFSYRTREDEAKEAAEEIRNMGSFAWYAKADMAQAGEGEKFFDQAVRKLGGLDLLVNNAGVTVFQSILDLEMEETQKMLNLDQPLDQFVSELQSKMQELKIGVLRIEKVDEESGKIILNVSEDADCSGLPILGETVCNYDEGFIGGILSMYSGKFYMAVEVDCWATGDRVCRFHANIEEEK
jgi:NAD(P)-dependent dehydrogenase (short-subunit alcohol dehydrogenase family)